MSGRRRSFLHPSSNDEVFRESDKTAMGRKLYKAYKDDSNAAEHFSSLADIGFRHGKKKGENNIFKSMGSFLTTKSSIPYSKKSKKSKKGYDENEQYFVNTFTSESKQGSLSMSLSEGTVHQTAVLVPVAVSEQAPFGYSIVPSPNTAQTINSEGSPSSWASGKKSKGSKKSDFSQVQDGQSNFISSPKFPTVPSPSPFAVGAASGNDLTLAINKNADDGLIASGSDQAFPNENTENIFIEENKSSSSDTFPSPNQVSIDNFPTYEYGMTPISLPSLTKNESFFYEEHLNATQSNDKPSSMASFPEKTLPSLSYENVLQITFLEGTRNVSSAGPTFFIFPRTPPTPSPLLASKPSLMNVGTVSIKEPTFFIIPHTPPTPMPVLSKPESELAMGNNKHIIADGLSSTPEPTYFVKHRTFPPLTPPSSESPSFFILPRTPNSVAASTLSPASNVLSKPSSSQTTTTDTIPSLLLSEIVGDAAEIEISSSALALFSNTSNDFDLNITQKDEGCEELLEGRVIITDTSIEINFIYDLYYDSSLNFSQILLNFEEKVVDSISPILLRCNVSSSSTISLTGITNDGKGRRKLISEAGVIGLSPLPHDEIYGNGYCVSQSMNSSCFQVFGEMTAYLKPGYIRASEDLARQEILLLVSKGMANDDFVDPEMGSLKSTFLGSPLNLDNDTPDGGTPGQAENTDFAANKTLSGLGISFVVFAVLGFVTIMLLVRRKRRYVVKMQKLEDDDSYIDSIFDNLSHTSKQQHEEYFSVTQIASNDDTIKSSIYEIPIIEEHQAPQIEPSVFRFDDEDHKHEAIGKSKSALISKISSYVPSSSLLAKSMPGGKKENNPVFVSVNSPPIRVINNDAKSPTIAHNSRKYQIHDTVNL